MLENFDFNLNIPPEFSHQASLELQVETVALLRTQFFQLCEIISLQSQVSTEAVKNKYEQSYLEACIGVQSYLLTKFGTFPQSSVL